jgi:hypothetical protein
MSLNEKTLPSYAYTPEQLQTDTKSRTFRRLATFMALTWIVLAAARYFAGPDSLPGVDYVPERVRGCANRVLDYIPSGGRVDHHGVALCPQYEVLVPSKKTENKELWKQLGETYQSEEWKAKAREWLAGAVRVP